MNDRHKELAHALAHKLRIAWSIVWGFAVVLLIALWARSYWWRDGLNGQLPRNRTFSISAAYGRVRYATFDKAYQDAFTGRTPPDWRAFNIRIKRPPNLKLVNTPLTDLGLGFASSSDQYGIVAVFPMWFPIGLLATLGALPLSGQLNWRFSLRTLLIATTLVAVVLGLIVAVL